MARVPLPSPNGAAPKFQLNEKQIADLGLRPSDVGETLVFQAELVVVGFSRSHNRKTGNNTREASVALTEGEIIRTP